MGFTKQMQNIGQVTNKGIELSINGDILRGKDYVLSANFTFGMNKMKIDKLNDTDDILWILDDRWKPDYDHLCSCNAIGQFSTLVVSIDAPLRMLLDNEDARQFIPTKLLKKNNLALTSMVSGW